MPNPSPLSNDSIARSASDPVDAPSADSLVHSVLDDSLRRPLQFVGFWSAIALPFVHVPLLLQGLSSPAETFVFLALLAVNVLALYVGHGYNQ